MYELRWVLRKRLNKQTEILKIVEYILEKVFPESQPGFLSLIITKLCVVCTYAIYTFMVSSTNV